MYKHILIATDGSALANQAVEHGLALAKQDKAPALVPSSGQPRILLMKSAKADQIRLDVTKKWKRRQPRKF